MQLLILLFLSALFSPTLIFAQPPERGQQRVGNDGMTYSERYREQIADQTRKPNTPMSGGGGLYKAPVSRRAIAEAEQQRAAQKGKEADEFRRRMARVDSIWDAEDREKRKMQQMQAKEEWPLRKLFMEAGFQLYPEQSDVLIEGIASHHNNTGLDLVMGMLSAKKIFNLDNQSQGFDFLATQVAEYSPMFMSALRDLDLLEKKFPSRVAAIDSLRLLSLSYAFGNTYPGFPTKKNSWCCDHFSTGEINEYYEREHPLAIEIIRRETLALFEKLADKYPVLADRIAATASVVDINNFSKNNPYVQLTRKYAGKPFAEQKNYELWKKNCLRAMHTPYAAEDEETTSIRLGGLLQFYSGDDFLKLIKHISKEEWQEIAIAQGLKSAKEIPILFIGKCLYPYQAKVKKELTKIAEKM